jgi:hypothetical protein
MPPRAGACQGWPRLARTPEGLGLDRPEHAGTIDRIGHGGRRDLPHSPNSPAKAKIKPLEFHEIHAAGDSGLKSFYYAEVMG